jgi:hypothetical protein
MAVTYAGCHGRYWTARVLRPGVAYMRALYRWVIGTVVAAKCPNLARR